MFCVCSQFLLFVCQMHFIYINVAISYPVDDMGTVLTISFASS